MKIAVGSDHAGLSLKKLIAAHLLANDHDVVDVGTHETTSCDYPDFARRVATLVASGEVDRGVLVCGTGQGMAMTANKVPGVRAAVVSDTFSARMVAAHNDARVLCLGERVVGPGLALACVDAWVATAFEGGRHGRRVAKMEGGDEG
ncbi:MAG: ribose 5-phosphate isomerase B [Alphaproteobacteria bacterium]|nr:ribose 5-phosphate isomerase B [Alphaproteobacteria bacterium]